MSVVTMQQFGKWGRAGNQFFQYAFLTGYAARHNAELQIPPWVGNQLFGTAEQLPQRKLPVWQEPGSGMEQPTPPEGDELVGHDFRGYAQYHTSYYAADKRRIRALFQPVGSVVARVGPAVSALRASGKTVIGIHLRRGDYGRGIFPVISTRWYLDWLGENWSRFDNPSLFIATESLALASEFAMYNPMTSPSLGVNLSMEPMADCTYLKEDIQLPTPEAMDWYPDFHLLGNCDVVLGPSSSFSFFAAMLNGGLQEYWRASLASERFDRTDPWDAYPQLRENVREYPHLDGVALPHNPPHW